MASKRNKKAFKKDLFSQSYNESVERLTGLKHYATFNIPSEILENRRQFWDQLFEKYIDQTTDGPELNICILESCEKEPVYKSLNVIQHWVNTGFLPYTKFDTNEDKQSDIGSLLTVKCLSSSHSSCNKPSSSSVDTAAYILSNTNTTNKAETMAIVEGAKDDILVIPQNTQSTKITESTIDKIHENSNENIVLQRNLDANVNKDTLSNTVDELTHDTVIDNNTPNRSKLMDERLMYTFDDSIRRNSYIKQNLLNMKLSHVEGTSSSKENFVLNSTIRKLGHPKKLYTGRDSPVDLIQMKTNNRNIISKLKQNLHPALDFGCKLSKKYKTYKKRRANHVSLLSKNLMNVSIFNTSSHNSRKRKKSNSSFSGSSTLLMDLKKSDDSLVTNNNSIDNRTIDEYLVKCNTESIDKEDKFNTSIEHVEKINTKKNKLSNEVISKFNDLNPVVSLTRLSKDDIETYKKSKVLTKNRRKLNTIQLSRHHMSTRRHKNLKKVTNLMNSSSSICFDKHDIQEYKRPNSMVKLNLNPVVDLKRLSEFEIMKCKNSDDMKKNLEILNTRVLLNKLSKSDIEKYTNVENNKVISKSDILSRPKQMQDDNININDQRHFSTSNYSNISLSVINLANDDTTSDQSTLLMRKCDSILFDNSSADNLSIFSKCSSQLYSNLTKADNDYILETKERFNQKRKELKIRKVENTISKYKLKVNTEKKYNTRNRKFKNIYKTDVSKTNLENLNKNQNISLSSSKTNMIYKNNSIYRNNNKKKPHTLFISDDDDEFVKLLHCSKDMQKLKLRQRYKELYKNFNGLVEKSEEVREDAGKCNNTKSSILLDQTLPKSVVEEKEENPLKRKKFLQVCNLSMEGDNKNETNLLCNMNIIQKKNRSCPNHLRYRTKIIESDSESLTMSY